MNGKTKYLISCKIYIFFNFVTKPKLSCEFIDVIPSFAWTGPNPFVCVICIGLGAKLRGNRLVNKVVVLKWDQSHQTNQCLLSLQGKNNLFSTAILLLTLAWSITLAHHTTFRPHQ